MSDYKKQLDAFLGQAYKAKYLNNSSTAAAVEALQADLYKDPAFLDYVKRQRDSFHSVVMLGGQSKCFVSKVNGDFLNEALEGIESSVQPGN